MILKREVRYVLAVVPFTWHYMILDRPVVWVETVTGEETVEEWSLKEKWLLRPRYWGLIKPLPCGCSKRFGRLLLIAMDCPEHGSPWLLNNADDDEEE